MNPLKVYIGYDPRESSALDVAEHSLRKHASGPVVVTALVLRKLEKSRMVTRPRALRGNQMWDIISCAPQSTEFACSRFVTPLLAQEGMAVFVDCDTVFKSDVYEMAREAEGVDKALFVVKHGYSPEGEVKMDNQQQTHYPRKNWSSVMLFNCDHRANERLTLDIINSLPGRDLHRFCWLEDKEIGDLSKGWNWLVGEQPKPLNLGIAHFTLGGPWLPRWEKHEHDEVWLEAEADMRAVRESSFTATSQACS